MCDISNITLGSGYSPYPLSKGLSLLILPIRLVSLLLGLDYKLEWARGVQYRRVFVGFSILSLFIHLEAMLVSSITSLIGVGVSFSLNGPMWISSLSSGILVNKFAYMTIMRRLEKIPS